MPKYPHRDRDRGPRRLEPDRPERGHCRKRHRQHHRQHAHDGRAGHRGLQRHTERQRPDRHERAVFDVKDQTGSAAGWNVTARSTQFKTAGGKTLPTSAVTVQSAWPFRRTPRAPIPRPGPTRSSALHKHMGRALTTCTTVVAAFAAATGVLPASSRAAEPSGGLTVRVVNANPTDLAARSSSALSLRPGARFTGHVVVGNTTQRAMRLAVSAVEGLTAVASGAVYAARTRRGAAPLAGSRHRSVGSRSHPGPPPRSASPFGYLPLPTSAITSQVSPSRT